MYPYKLFISHSWSYSDQYDGLLKLLRNEPRFDFRNYSVPKNDPIHNAPNSAALSEAIRNQMVFCDVILIVVGVYSSYSKWIIKEIAIAQSFSKPKPILAIEPWGSYRTSYVKEHADATVGWNGASIVSAIRSLA